MAAEPNRLKTSVTLLKQTFKEFSDDSCSSMAAALSYYTIFSLPALLVVILMIAQPFIDPSTVQQTIQDNVASMISEQAADEITGMIENAGRDNTGGPMATLLGLVGLLFGATGAFAQLQQALNRAWEVQPDPEEGGLKNFVTKRVLSFGMILVIAFLLLVAVALSAALAGLNLEGFLGSTSQVLMRLINEAVNLGIITLLFAALFKVLPDAEIAWKDVWLGAFITAILFVVGKFLIGLYLGRSDPGSAFGAAGSLAVILVWIYYSSMILFLGAEFTQVWIRHKDRLIMPSKGAVRIVEDHKLLRPDDILGVSEPDADFDRQGRRVDEAG